MAKARTNAPGRRRQPKRRTGAAIVDAVVIAAEKILSEQGAEALTTSRLAKVSGVSVGSIYQYFDSKQAVVGELARRLERRGLEVFSEQLAKVRDRPLREIIHAVVGSLGAREVGDVEMRRIVQQDIPRSWSEKASREVDEAADKVVSQLLEEHSEETRDGDNKLMAFVIARSVEAIFEAAVREGEDLVRSEALHREVRHLVWSYVRRDNPVDD